MATPRPSVLLAAALLASVLASALAQNFNYGTTSCPGTGYTQDTGAPYGAHGSLRYGWIDSTTSQPVNASSRARRRDATGYTCITNQFIHMQLPDPAVIWQIALANGLYNVTAGLGDPQYRDSKLSVRGNGVTIVAPYTPTVSRPIIEGTAQVRVSNGLLKLSPLPDGTNTKLNYVKIVSSTATTSPTPTPSASPTPPATTGCRPSPSEFNNRLISTLPCRSVRVDVPFNLGFSGSQPGVPDSKGTSTGLTMFMPNKLAVSTNYWRPSNTTVTSGGLVFAAPKGTLQGTTNTEVNNLGVMAPLPTRSNYTMHLETTWRLPSTLGGPRACTLFGISDRDIASLCLVNVNAGQVQLSFRLEQGDAQSSSKTINVPRTGDSWQLRFDLNSDLYNITASYRVVGAAAYTPVASVTVPGLWFSTDQAGLDENIGSRSYLGVYTSSGSNAAGTVSYTLTQFSIALDKATDGGGGTPPPTTGIDFTWWTIANVGYVTAMTFCQDRHLYVTDASANLYRLQLSGDRTSEVSRMTYKPVGTRLALGLACDPGSTQTQVTLWMSHSDAPQDGAAANSGIISRLSGADFSTRADVVVGLPRSIADHSVNSIHFGPDGLLYFTVGGNSPGGAPNTLGSQFGTRPEQCLSAAMLRADVRNPAFNGKCTSSQDPDEMDRTGIANRAECATLCDVKVFATGIRNSYDHTRAYGKIFATDNGLGGLGTFPVLPSGWVEGQPCDGLVTGQDAVANNPGVREDLLHDLTQGGYHGHPNPTRLECIYYGGNPTSAADYPVPRLPLNGGGTYPMEATQYPVGRKPQSTWKRPIFSWGKNKSPDGIITYAASTFCGKLQNNLLATYYSVDKQVRRVVLDSGGNPTFDETLPRTTTDTGADADLKDPLPIAQDNVGTIFVGEFRGNSIRVLVPRPAICSTRTLANSPMSHLADAAHVSVRGRLYTFGGERVIFTDTQGELLTSEEAQCARSTNATRSRAAFRYEVEDDRWRSVAAMPAARSGAAAASTLEHADHADGRGGDGDVLLFGGVDAAGRPSAHVLEYSTDRDEYRNLVDMPAPRAHAAAVFVDGRALVIGGRGADGAALSSVLALSTERGRWRELAALSQAREGAIASVGADGGVLVCGGSDGAGNVLASCERFDGRRWTRVADMPTPRRNAGVLGLRRGNMLVQGGEVQGGALSDAVEQYDPHADRWTRVGAMRVGRSGGVYAKFGTGAYSFGGRITHDVHRMGEVIHYEL